MRPRRPLVALFAATCGALALQAVPALAGASPVSVSIQSPAAGGTVSGSITVSGSASSKFGIQSVRVAVDSGAAQTATLGTKSGWTFALNTNTLSNAAHRLTATATDKRGNSSSASETVTVNNPPPTIAISSPTAGASVAGSVSVSGTAASASGISAVQVELDSNGWVNASGSTNWSATVDVSAATDGTHTLSAKATDAYGRSTTTSESVTVANPLHITITNPAAGSTDSGYLTVTGTADGPASINDVAVQVDQCGCIVATGTSSWSVQIDTSQYTYAAHTITATVYDSAGHSATASVSVTFAAPSPPFTTNQSPWFLPDSTGGVSTVNETMTWEGGGQSNSPLPTGTITFEAAANTQLADTNPLDTCSLNASGDWTCSHPIQSGDLQFSAPNGGWSLHYAFQFQGEFPASVSFTVGYSGDSEFLPSSAVARMT
ncbi:MAG TPA: Ig-like domain-containing protein [Candidatus Dormibacteraeota bacterium]